jgi:hypothetical protein
VGFGASGRNGGWCSSKFPVTPAMLEHRYGVDSARALMLAMCGAVDEVARVCGEEGIDAQFHKGGILTQPVKASGSDLAASFFFARFAVKLFHADGILAVGSSSLRSRRDPARTLHFVR